MDATLDALATALYVQIDDFLPARLGPGHPPKLSDAELITLAVCQMLLGLPNDRQFLALVRYRLGHLFPNLIKQPGYNKRVRRLGPQITQAIIHLAQVSPSFVDKLRLLDCRLRAEVLVDTVTYIVCAGAGLDVSGESVPYVAGGARTTRPPPCASSPPRSTRSRDASRRRSTPTRSTPSPRSRRPLRA